MYEAKGRANSLKAWSAFSQGLLLAMAAVQTIRVWQAGLLGLDLCCIGCIAMTLRVPGTVAL